MKKEEAVELFDELYFGQAGLEDLKALHMIKQKRLKKHIEAMEIQFYKLAYKYTKGERGSLNNSKESKKLWFTKETAQKFWNDDTICNKTESEVKDE